MRIELRHTAVWFVVAALTGCSSEQGANYAVSGMAGTAAVPETGGVSSGGNLATGGIGTSGTGGVPGFGGLIQSGGVPGSGGLTESGGVPGSGGVTQSGGVPGSGGVIQSGGVPGSGGLTQSGGASGSGGAGTGGMATGGSAGGTGGVATGGAGGAGTGGTEPTGGAGGSGTGGSTVQCDTEWDTYPDKGDGLALTPPMGWNSWNVFHENINENQIREIADAMVSSGMKDAGYQYLNLDDRWMDDDGRDAQGNLVGDSVRFPSGIAALADYVHSLGLKLGVYGDRGTATCANVRDSGSYGHETQDAQTLAGWGVDYLKYDNCNIAAGRDNDQAQRQDYETMAAALRATGRPIVFSICAWDAKDWMPNTGHLWRSTWDIDDCWDKDAGFCAQGSWQRGILQIIDENNETPQYAGPGHWNDPDMLEVGNGGMSNTEYIAHFSLWAIMAAPLIAGNDLRSMSNEIRDILTNEEVIAVDQDPAGIQGTRVVDNGDLEVWMKPLCRHEGPEKAVALLNRRSNSADISVSFDAIGISGSATVRDLWAHQDLGQYSDSFSANVPSHGVVMVKIVHTDGG
jgi:hypothetical protein